jgi:hypothetical protein
MKQDFFFYRSEGLFEGFEHRSLDEWTGWMFFNTWNTRRDPFPTGKNDDGLAAGDRLFPFTLRGDRKVIAELLVANVYAERFNSLKEAEKGLLDTFGLAAGDLTHHENPAKEGYVLAFNVDVVQRLDLELPKEFNRLDRLNRDGYVRRSLLKEPETIKWADDNLPDPGHRVYRRAVTLKYELTDLGGNKRPPIRSSVKRAALKQWREMGRECQNPKCDKAGPRNEFHIDHIHPVSKGGSNKIENLQVLCVKCNLSKGAKMPGTF